MRRANGAEVRPQPRRKTLPSHRIDPQKTLSRVLNSSSNFAAAIAFLGHAKNYDRYSVEYTALLLGALVSYARPFKDGEGSVLGRALHEIPIFLDAAVDLGVDLELHLKILRLSGQAIGGHLFAEQLDVGAFEQISHLMRLACVFTLAEVGGSNSKTTS